MIKDFNTYVNEGLFDRNPSEFTIGKTNRGIEQVYTPKTKDELYKCIKLDIERAKKEGTYPNVNLNNIDVSEVKRFKSVLEYLFSNFEDTFDIVPDISNWNINELPDRFFDKNEQIKEFTIPNNVRSIGMYAFSRCRSLTSVTIPNSVEYIGDYAFEDCCSLTTVIIPNSVTRIGNWVFWDCSDLASIEIPNSVTSIGTNAFLGCSNLTSVTISNDCHIGTSSLPKNCKIIRR